jgi:hypothetical protein
MLYTRVSFHDLALPVLPQFKWDHVHRRITHFVEKTVYDRAVKQDVPT